MKIYKGEIRIFVSCEAKNLDEATNKIERAAEKFGRGRDSSGNVDVDNWIADNIEEA